MILAYSTSRAPIHTTTATMLMLDKTKMKKDISSSSSCDVPDHFLCSIRWVSKTLTMMRQQV